MEGFSFMFHSPIESPSRRGSSISISGDNSNLMFKGFSLELILNS
jgi:hypothetical protein